MIRQTIEFNWILIYRVQNHLTWDFETEEHWSLTHVSKTSSCMAARILVKKMPFVSLAEHHINNEIGQQMYNDKGEKTDTDVINKKSGMKPVWMRNMKEARRIRIKSIPMFTHLCLFFVGAFCLLVILLQNCTWIENFFCTQAFSANLGEDALHITIVTMYV